MKTTALLAFGLAGLAGLLSGCNSRTNAVLGMAIPRPQPDKGLIVFYRQANVLDVAKPYPVKEDNVIVGQLANSTYVAYYAEPGTHVYTTSSSARPGKSLEIVAGMTYFMEVAKSKADITQPRMRVASLREAQSAMPRMSYVDLASGNPAAELASAR